MYSHLVPVGSSASYLNARQLRDSTKRAKLNAVKSLFSFGTKLNYFRFNVAAALRIPKRNSILAGRVVRQIEIFKLSDRGTSNPRDRFQEQALSKLSYKLLTLVLAQPFDSTLSNRSDKSKYSF
jgi:site-specific recombinase XerD